MTELRQYIISITAAAMLCGIVSSLVKNASAKEGIRLLCGLFLSFTVLEPLTHMDISWLTPYFSSFLQEGNYAAETGSGIGDAALSDIIKAESEAYILDKAMEMHADITVAVTLSRGALPVPVKVSISGQVAPYTRQRLMAMIQKDLGITKENQIWTG